MQEYTQKVNQKVRGFMVFYLNVGALPPKKAEDYIKRVKETWIKEVKDELPEDIKIMCIPVREHDTCVEYLSLE